MRKFLFLLFCIDIRSGGWVSTRNKIFLPGFYQGKLIGKINSSFVFLKEEVEERGEPESHGDRSRGSPWLSGSPRGAYGACESRASHGSEDCLTHIVV